MNVIFDPGTAIYPLPPRPTPLGVDKKTYHREKIEHLLEEHNMVMAVHYYTNPETQRLVERIGDCISDSLEMTRFGIKHPASTLLIAGVRFVGETIKILSPGETILMSTLQAECSLDLGCPVKEFSTFCDAHPDRIIVVYVNASAAVKAHADWMVTSGIIVELIDHLDSLSEKIIWALDKRLGYYV